MFNTRSLLAAAAIAALASTPVLAIDVPADAMLGAAPEDMSTVKVMENSAFIGNEVRTKDQKVVGQVEGIYSGVDGSQVVLVALNSDVGSKSDIKRFTVPLTVDAVADGSLTLGWTEDELFIALSSNLATSN